METGVPSRVAPSAAGSNTHTSARPMPGVERIVSIVAWKGVFCPRWAVVMNARTPVAPGGSANTMSRGSSPTSSVRTTRGGVAPASTMLMLSERWLTTHTSVSVRAATAIGSRPTGTEPACVRAPVPAFTSKISSWLSGVLIANSRVWLGLNAIGRTCPVSKVTNAAPLVAKVATHAEARARSPLKPDLI
jgi:hypothetical protein